MNYRERNKLLHMETQTILRSTRDWNKEYREGVHWDNGRHSSRIEDFIDYVNVDDMILDAGCGTGRDVNYLDQLGFRTIGIDISFEAIKIAYERSRGLTNSKFVTGEIEELPYPENTFDLIYSGYTLQRTVFNRAFPELYRVLKSDGILYAVIFTETKYEIPNIKDLFVPRLMLLDALRSSHFFVIKETADRFAEEDHDGLHYHTRLVIIAKKLASKEIA